MEKEDVRQKIVGSDELRRRCAAWRDDGRKIVTTNGVFDILHGGHILSLRHAAAQGDILVVGVNSDDSVRRYKGPLRPFLTQEERAVQVASLPLVNAVHIFDEDTPDRFLIDVVPHIHCKGSQYATLPEESTLRRLGAQISPAPMLEGKSTTDIARRVFERQLAALPQHVQETVIAHQEFAASEGPAVTDAATRSIMDALRAGKKVFFCGNGGSAATAQHFAAELVGRFKFDRRALPAIALTTDSSVLTAIGNDYGYDSLFSRQLEALAVPGDVLVCLSTSGASPNIIKALECATLRGLVTLLFTGAKRGPALKPAQYGIVIPSTNTSIIQEHTDFLLHRMCEKIEITLCKN